MKRLLLFLLFFFHCCAYDFAGTHYTASYYGCNPDKLVNQLYMVPYFIKAIDRSGATLLRLTKHTFDNGAICVCALLSESHATIHTYPEHGSVFVDLFTCGDECDWRPFESVLQEYFECAKIRRKIRNRR